jgi:predicted DNA-binding ribbon-helix-helix protein
MSRLVKHSFALAGHRTSVALEPEFWAALQAITARRGLPLAALVAEVDTSRDPETGLASALRVFCVKSLPGAAAAIGSQ